MDPVQERIEHRAYDLYLKRGKVPGFHEEDWACAEKEILAEIGQNGNIDKIFQEPGNSYHLEQSGNFEPAFSQDESVQPGEPAIIEKSGEMPLAIAGPALPVRPSSRSRKLPGNEVRRAQNKN